MFCIVGAGLAGDTAAATLREDGYQGQILLLSEEPHAPYDRPPLSKELLTGAFTEDRIYLRAAGWYEEQDIDLRVGVAATAVDRTAKQLILSTGERLTYDKLLIATGTRARSFPGAENACVLRTLEDARRIGAALEPGRRLAIVGAGVIGLEVAASAVTRGCAVDVVDIADRVMSRIAPPAYSDFIAAMHRDKGVHLHLSCGSVAVTQRGVSTDTTGELPADLVVIGIGVTPNTALAEAAGLECRDGIIVDAQCRTSDPDIFAVGDCARYPDPFGSGLIRCENWKHAQAQAVVAARNMLGCDEAYQAASNMWSDQYDVKLQTVGTLAGQQVQRGDFGGPKFMTLYLGDGGALVGAIGVNMAKDIRFAQALIEKRAVIDPALLADPKQDLRKLAK